MNDENQRFLVGTLRWATNLLERAAGEEAGDANDGPLPGDDIPFGRMYDGFGLSPVEARVVRLALAWAIDPEISRLLARIPARLATAELIIGDVARLFAGNDPVARVESLALAQPDARLRTLRLVEPLVQTSEPLLARPIRLTQAAVRMLVGGDQRGPYHALIRSGAPRPAVVPAAQRETVTQALLAAAAAFQANDAEVKRGRSAIALLLLGPNGVGKATFARELAAQFFPALVEIDGAALALAPDPALALRDAFDCAMLNSAAVLLRNGHALLKNASWARAFQAEIDSCHTCIFVTSIERDLTPALDAEWFLIAYLEKPPPELSSAIWRSNLPSTRQLSDDDLADVGERFPLGGVSVARATRLALAQSRGELTREALEQAADLQLGINIADLVRVVRPRYALSALVLPNEELRQIYDIIDAYQSWHHVMGRWGLGERLGSGKCISCLFYGEPGTGKTFAAEVIASTIGKPLHIVSLPNILSKWMGETERNIQDLFERSRLSSAALLLDEADALFSTRVDVKSAQDHAMNMTTGLLLQEIERHTGLVMMTTNLSENIDPAFQRRILFSLEFPKPDEHARAKILNGLLPERMPLAGNVDVTALARRFELSGGELKNAVLRASFRAWAEQQPVTQEHLIDALELEYRNTGRVLISKRR